MLAKITWVLADRDAVYLVGLERRYALQNPATNFDVEARLYFPNRSFKETIHWQ